MLPRVLATQCAMGCAVLRRQTKEFNPAQVVPVFDSEVSAKSRTSNEDRDSAVRQLSARVSSAFGGSSGGPYSEGCEGDDSDGKSSSSSSEDGPCGPEEMWMKQARRIARQEKRRQRSAKKAKAKGGDAPKSLEMCYTIGARLGHGTYSSVSRCTHTSTGVQHALKTIERKKAPSPGQIKEEIEIMKLLGEDNNSLIVHLHETFEDTKHVHLVLELCTGGELFTSISTSARNGFAERIAARISRQVVSAVLYMHRKRVAHRDVKPENFMLREQKDITETTIKAIDFGMSKRFVPGEFMTTSACSPSYVAPEVLSNHYTEACDMWSFGVLVFVLLCGRAPFQGKGAELEQKVRKGSYDFDSPPWSAVSAEAKSVVQSLLVLDFSARATAAQILDHRWHALARTSGVASE